MASVLKGETSLNAPSSKGTLHRKLSNYQPLPSGSGGTSSPLFLHLNPDLLGVHGISINRVEPGLEHPVSMPILPPLITSIRFVAHTFFHSTYWPLILLYLKTAFFLFLFLSHTPLEHFNRVTSILCCLSLFF